MKEVTLSRTKFLKLIEETLFSIDEIDALEIRKRENHIEFRTENNHGQIEKQDVSIKLKTTKS